MSAAPSRAEKRLGKESKKLDAKPLPFVKLIDTKDLFLWKVSLVGPPKTPFEGGTFVVELKMEPNYPMRAPKVRFLTKTFHPLISMKDGGAICQNIVEKDWSPVLNTAHVLTRVYKMLENVTADSAVDAEIAIMFSTNRAKYDATAKAWTAKYAR